MFRVTTRSKALLFSSVCIFGAVCPVCIECSRVAVYEILNTAQVQQASFPILHPSNCMWKVPLLRGLSIVQNLVLFFSSNTMTG